jgi:hypothetical protein
MTRFYDSALLPFCKMCEIFGIPLYQSDILLAPLLGLLQSDFESDVAKLKSETPCSGFQTLPPRHVPPHKCRLPNLFTRTLKLDISQKKQNPANPTPDGAITPLFRSSEQRQTTSQLSWQVLQKAILRVCCSWKPRLLLHRR